MHWRRRCRLAARLRRAALKSSSNEFHVRSAVLCSRHMAEQQAPCLCGCDMALLPEWGALTFGTIGQDTQRLHLAMTGCIKLGVWCPPAG